MREHRYVAICERGLPVGDRVERDARIGDNPLAVLARDLAVDFGTVGELTLPLHALRGTADLVLRFKRDALRFQRAVIDARIDVEFGEPRLDMGLPSLAPLAAIRMIVPIGRAN